MSLWCCEKSRRVGTQNAIYACAVGLAMCSGVGNAAAQDETLPKLYTNEQYVTDVTKRSSLDIENVKAVFEFVFSQLPERVQVFPTENYYYFYFYHGGIKYAGNIRFDVEDRDKGLVEFIYFKDTTDLLEDEIDYHATLGKTDDVLVEKVEDLVYRVSYAGKSVAFQFIDLSEVKPPDGTLGENETYLGPVQDESGIRFFLIFDETLKAFRYVLDETVPVADELVEVRGPGRGLEHISVGRRTSFAFFKDPNFNRKLLVGVLERNSAVNNYFDGPFDQLPDNFLEGDELRRALLKARPELEGRIDRLGISPDGLFRERIAPYISYLGVEELAPLNKCAEEAVAEAVALCLSELFPE